MSSTALRFLRLPENSRLSLRDQICEVVSAAIMSDALAYDRPLPSCRELAEQLSVSRNTVFAAYNRLVDIEFLVSRDRSGYFVHPKMDAMQKARGKARAAERETQACPVDFKPNTLEPIIMPVDYRSYPYPFIYNQTDPDLFPVDGWRECSRQVLGRARMPVWASDAVESDSPQLVQQLRQRLLTTRGIHAEEDEILITLGAQNALFLLGSIFARQGHPVAMENPGYFGARNAFVQTGNTLIGVPVDGEGLIPSAIPAGCQLVFTTPSHQFPTMVTMSQARREELIATAVDKDLIIIEDDYDVAMNYIANTPLSLRSMDETGRVIYVGSLSKIVSKGLRVGFIVAHRDIIRQARIARGVMMRHPPTIVQEILALFFRLGHYEAHVQKIGQRFNERWHAMNDAIDTHLGMLHRSRTEGSTSFWLTGPEGFDSNVLAARLSEKGVLIDKGQRYFLSNSDRRSFRLGFAYLPVSKFKPGIKLIAEEVGDLL
ncbi:MAG: PLP-dependent aminotransferase family protein [Pseudomonadota bacterium]